MRAPILILSLLLVMPATAQEGHAGCSQQEPCTWIVDVDDDGFADNSIDGAVYNGTAGDWFTVNITNFGEVEHTITFEGYGMVWTVGSIDAVESDPFLLDENGTFHLVDDPSGDRATVNVFLGDVVDEEQDGTQTSTTGGGRGSPGPAAAAFIGLLLVLVWARRR